MRSAPPALERITKSSRRSCAGLFPGPPLLCWRFMLCPCTSGEGLASCRAPGQLPAAESRLKQLSGHRRSSLKKTGAVVPKVRNFA